LPKSLSSMLALSLLMLGCSRGGAAPSPAPSPSNTAATVPTMPADPNADRLLPEPLPAVAARVNGTEVPMQHVKIMATNMLRGGAETPVNRARAYRAAGEQLITREVLFQEALNRKVQADSATLDREYDQAHAGFKEEKAWTEFLAKQGLDPQSFKKELRIRGTVNALLRQVADQVKGPLTDEEVKKYYDANPALFETGPRVRASHILVLVPQGTDEKGKAALRAKAEGLLKRIKSGEDFAAIARTSSEDKGSAAQGGELPPFGKGAMVPPFEAASFALPAGGLSDLVESQFGFHIIKVHEKLPAEKASFESVKDRLAEHLLNLKREEAVTLYINGLRAKAKIENYL
jgi:peptidyl-prolyl cis-trans isomerase C